MKKPRIDIFEAEIEGTRWLQVSATQAGTTVATATVYFLFDDGAAPQLCNLFVQEEARRQGIAKAVVAAVSRYMKRPYCLHVVKDSPAHQLYYSLGFLAIGDVKDKPASIWMMSPA